MPQKHDHLKHFIQIIIRKRAKEQHSTEHDATKDLNFSLSKETAKEKAKT